MPAEIGAKPKFKLPTRLPALRQGDSVLPEGYLYAGDAADAAGEGTKLLLQFLRSPSPDSARVRLRFSLVSRLEALFARI